MTYDNTKDECLGSFTYEGENSNLIISVSSYNKGDPKLQFSRVIISNDNSEKFVKLGRLSKNEIMFFLQYKNEILDLLNKE